MYAIKDNGRYRHNNWFKQLRGQVDEFLQEHKMLYQFGLAYFYFST